MDISERNKMFEQRLREHTESIYQPIKKETLTKYNVKSGLRNSDGTGVVIGLTSIGEVAGYYMEDGEKMPMEGHLRYRGYDLSTLVKSCENDKRFGFEEVVYLLLFGELPNAEELKGFVRYIGRHRALPAGFTEDMIMKAPSRNIMNKLARSVLAAYSYDEDPDDISTGNLLRQSIQLISRLPVMASYAYQAKRHYHDGQSLFIHSPQEELSTAENILYMLRPDNKYTREEAVLLDTMLMVHAEHGGGNNSAFTVKVVSSTDTDTYSAIAAAIGSLKGPKHGGANAKVMGMVEEIKENVKDWTDEDELKSYLVKILKKEAFDHSGLIYGMGHAIYTLSDPRAVLIKEQAEKLLNDRPEFIAEYNLYKLIEKLTPAVFKEVRNNDKVMCANVDMYSGFIYKILGIPEELYTPLFAISRIAGWAAHRIEEVKVNGKIYRPACKSISKAKEYVDLANR